MSTNTSSNTNTAAASAKSPNKSKPKRRERRGQATANERLKAVVRRLPPNLPEEIFWSSVQSWVTETTVSWRAFYPGKLRSRWASMSCNTALNLQPAFLESTRRISHRGPTLHSRQRRIWLFSAKSTTVMFSEIRQVSRNLTSSMATLYVTCTILRCRVIRRSRVRTVSKGSRREKERGS
jgi:hypothetical protein